MSFPKAYFEYGAYPPEQVHTPSSQDAFLMNETGPRGFVLARPEVERHPSLFSRFVEYLIPVGGAGILCSGCLVLMWMSHLSPIVAPAALETLGLYHAKIATALYTFCATIAAALLSYFYSRAVRLVIRKFIVARSHRLKTLSGWIDLRNRSLSTVRGPLWLGCTLLSAALIGFLTTCFNTLITPLPTPIPMNMATSEADMSSTNFNNWYSTQVNNVNCSWWVPYRGGLSPTCVVGNALPALLDAGRAAVDVDLLANAGYTWFGKTVFSGTTGGVLPLDPDGMWGIISNAAKGPESLAVADGRYNFTLGMQGLSASVSCTNSSDSPLYYDSVQDLNIGRQVESKCSCSGSSVWQVIGGNSVQGGMCNSSDENSWYFYLRHYGAYSRDGYENVTCLITPYHTSATVSYSGISDLFNISNVVPLSRTGSEVLFSGMLALLPQLVDLGQNSQNNLVLESVTAVTNAFYAHDEFDMIYGHVWERYLVGWMEYIATSIRLQYQSTGPPPTSPVSGQLTVSTLAWVYTPIDIAFISPITFLSLLTLFLALWALTHLGGAKLPTFDPTDTVSLIVASAYADEPLRGALRTSAERGCDGAERGARDTRVRFQGSGLKRSRDY